MDPTVLVSPKNFALAAAILVVISFARNTAPTFFARRPVQRFLPLLPIILSCAAFGLGFGDAGDTPTWQDRLVAAVLTGAAASATYKVGRTTVLGRGMDAEMPTAIPETASTPDSTSPPSAGG